MKVFILYEHGVDPRPYASSYIRLLRPLTHPGLSGKVETRWGLQYEGQPADLVIVDRLWRPDISTAMASCLADEVHRAGARLIYAIDDDLFEALSRSNHPAKQELMRVVDFFLRCSDGVMVTTDILRQRFTAFNPHIVIVPNMLDERLLPRGKCSPLESPFGAPKRIIGCMGTFTHDDDLEMILPALRVVCERHPNEIEIQLIGMVEHFGNKPQWEGLPVRMVSPKSEESEYPLFMLWFCHRVNWDIAIAPLQDNAFNQCKSDIKFLDYCALGAAGIYSRVPPYSSVQHLETGWLTGNEPAAWAEAMEQLLVDSELRARIARNASCYLFQNRTLAQSGCMWQQTLETLLSF